jgi:glycosyltransferase involved in cell wall biosynthesis
MRLCRSEVKTARAGAASRSCRGRNQAEVHEARYSRAVLSVVVPLFNEQENVPPLMDRLGRVLEGLGEPYEVVCVDDGSTDQTPALLSDLHQRDGRWKVLTLSRNFGHQSALSAGLYYSRGDAVAVLDGDLQDPPEELPRLWAKLREGYEVVYAIRTHRKEWFGKRMAYFLFYRLLHLLSPLEMPRDAGDFCVMSQAVVDVLRALPERSRFVRGLRTWSGFRQTGVAYERQARAGGEPKYSFTRLVKLAADGILSFSNVPLKLAQWMGLGMCGVSLASIAGLVVWYVAGVRVAGMRPNDVVGWTSLAAMILFLSGVQMLLIGVVGAYLARVFEEVKAREPWIIQRALGVTPAAGRPAVGWHVTGNGPAGTLATAPELRRA